MIPSDLHRSPKAEEIPRKYQLDKCRWSRLKWNPFPPNEIGRIAKHVWKGEGQKQSKGRGLSLFSSGKLFHYIYLFQQVYSCVLFDGDPCTLMTTNRDVPPIVVLFLYLTESNFLSYRFLSNYCKWRKCNSNNNTNNKSDFINPLGPELINRLLAIHLIFCRQSWTNIQLFWGVVNTSSPLTVLTF